MRLTWERGTCPAPGHSPMCWGVVRMWLLWLNAPASMRREKQSVEIQPDGNRCLMELL